MTARGDSHDAGPRHPRRIQDTSMPFGESLYIHLSGARPRRRTPPVGDCLTSRPAALALNTIPRTPRRLCPAQLQDHSD